jgi:hypothetical protein
MSEAVPIPFSKAQIIAAVEGHLNRTFFKRYHRITDLEVSEHKGIFIVTAEPIIKETGESKTKKTNKRGLNPKVLGKSQQANSHTEEQRAE